MRLNTINLPSQVGIQLLFASLLGMLVGALPISISLLILGLLLLGLFASISPLAGLVAVLTLSPLRTLIATESNFQLPLDIGQIGFIALLGIYIITRIVQRRPLFMPLPFALNSLFLLILLATGLSAFSALSMSAWLLEWVKWWVIVASAYLSFNMARNHPQWLVFALTIAGLGNAFIGLYIFFGGSGAEHLLVAGRFFRAFGTFGQPNPFGGFMGILVPITLGASLGYFQRWWQTRSRVALHWMLFYAFSSLMLSAALFTSWSRGAWLGMGISLLVMAFAIPQRLKVSLIAVLSISFIGGLAWSSGLLPASVVNRVTSAAGDFITISDVRGVEITNENYAVIERLAHWQAAINISQAHPWLGVGLGNYEIAYPQYRLMFWEMALGHAHNYYLNILAEGGMIGLTAYLSFWALIVWLTWRLRRHPDPLMRSLGIALLGTWTYLAVHSLLDNLYVNNVFIHFGVLLGLLAIIHEQLQRLSKRG